MKIGHNLLAINANNFLGISTKRRDNLVEKLSSGYRINRAGDDAAGLSISEKMRSQIRGLGQASRNAQDGISLIQTADGALNEVHSILQRIHELSTEAANDTYTGDDRENIQKEINQLIKEVDNISTNTEFNTLKLLDGTMTGTTTTTSPLVALGESNSMTIQELLSSPSENLNIIYVNETDNFETIQSGAGTGTIGGYDELKNDLYLEIVPQAVTSILNAFSPAFDYLKTSSIGIGLNLYTDTLSTTLAYVGVSGSLGGSGSFLSYQLGINMASLSFGGDGHLTAGSRTALETTIVHEMVHGLMDEALTNGMLGLPSASNSFPDWFVEGMAQSAAGGYSNSNDWVNAGLGIITSTSEADISAKVKSASNSLTSGSTSSMYATGYLASMYLGYLASGSTNVTAGDISNGLGKILSDLIGGKSLDTVINERS